MTDNRVEFPSTKYKVGDKLYFLAGAQCLPFTVSAIMFVVMENNVVQFIYKYDDPVSKKPVNAQESQLIATWEEAKEVMKAAIDQAVKNAYAQLETVKDPYTLAENE